MTRILIGLIFTLLSLSCFSQNTNDKTLEYLTNQEWQYTYNSAEKLSQLMFKEIQHNFSKSKWKKILKEKDEYLGYFKDMCLNAKIVYDTDSVTTFFYDNELKEKWTFQTQENKIIINPKDSLTTKHLKTIILSKNRFSFINNEGIQLDMIPALQKLDSSAFQNISELGAFFGNPNSDIVIVNTQGGPVNELFEDEFTSIIRSSQVKGLLYVNVHQAQTQSPDQFKNKDITFKQAIAFDKESVSKLKKVISYFKGQNKKVYVLGISFGAFVAQELLAEYGTDIADGYYIMVGRLDINPEIWKAFSQGKNGMFKYKTNGEFRIKLKKQKDILDRNMSKLAAGLGHHRYTQKLRHLKDLSKVNYVFGDRDEQVGGLSSAEIKFLKERKAKLTEVSMGTHGSAINEGIKLLKSLNGDK